VIFKDDLIEHIDLSCVANCAFILSSYSRMSTCIVTSSLHEQLRLLAIY